MVARLERLCATSLWRTPTAGFAVLRGRAKARPKSLPAILSNSRGYAPESHLAPNKTPLKKPPYGGFLNGGAPGEIRTPDRLVRSQVLYPTELQALDSLADFKGIQTHFQSSPLVPGEIAKYIPVLRPYARPSVALRGRPAGVQNRSRRFCRTPDRLVRSQVLYPTELQAQYLEGAILRVSTANY